MNPQARLEQYRRVVGNLVSPPGAAYGAFVVPGPSGRELIIISSGSGDGTGWEHVSVSMRKHAPNWREMCFVKSLFWADEDCVVQFHPPAASYVNNHPFCLHLWRWTGGKFPMPPDILVGVKELGELPV